MYDTAFSRELKFTERPEFLRGRAAEERVAAWLKERGWYIIPSFDYSGPDDDKPPRLQGNRSAWAVPDLDTARAGERRWVEVKSKRKANIFRNPFYWGEANTPEHGIDQKSYAQYLKVQEITGTKVYLVIFEEDTGALLGAFLDDLGRPRDGIFHGRRLVNWPRARFTVLAEKLTPHHTNSASDGASSLAASVAIL